MIAFILSVLGLTPKSVILQQRAKYYTMAAKDRQLMQSWNSNRYDWN